MRASRSPASGVPLEDPGPQLQPRTREPDDARKPPEGGDQPPRQPPDRPG